MLSIVPRRETTTTSPRQQSWYRREQVEMILLERQSQMLRDSSVTGTSVADGSVLASWLSAGALGLG